MSPIDSEQLDKLMDLALNGDSGEKESESSNNNNDNDKLPVEKVYRKPKKRVSSFKFPYQSPVIKSSNVIYDPESDISESVNKVVVRSLDNYMEYVMNKNVNH